MPKISGRRQKAAAALQARYAIGSAAPRVAAQEAEPSEEDATHSDIFTRPGRPRSGVDVQARHWDDAETMLASWKADCASVLGDLKLCGFCGFAFLGGQVTKTRNVPYTLLPPLDADAVPPYAAKNIELAEYCAVGDKWVVCNDCKTHGWERDAFVPFTTPEYKRDWFDIDPAKHAYFSMLDADFRITNNFDRHMPSGRLSDHSLFDGPLVQNPIQPPGDNDELIPIYSVLGLNKVLNPLYSQFKTMLEIDRIRGFPVLDQACIDAIVGKARSRGPMVQEMELGMRCSSAANEMCSLRLYQDVGKRSDVLLAGHLHLAGGGIDYLYTNSVGEDVKVTVRGNATAEQLINSTLFPHGAGHYFRAYDKFTFNKYCGMRMGAWCSMYTMTPTYVLTLHNLFMSNKIAQTTSEVVLEKHIQDHLKAHPNASRQEAIRESIKFNVSGTVPGSPSYHRQKLSDLLARVRLHGIPDLFLTLTADEVSELRWPEIQTLEDDFLSRFARGEKVRSYKDAPVECAKIFIRRVKMLMNRYILSKPELLGNVHHYVIRYEVQHRGSLHAHIVLWIGAQEVDRVADEITAHVPAEYDVVNDRFVPPDDGMQRKLFDIVTRKQLHVCTSGRYTSNRDRRCKYKFPMPPHPRGTEYDQQLKRFVYYRPAPPQGYRRQDEGPHRNVVPYHPTVLLLWNAHMNIQRVTNKSWSAYLLKYAMKAEPTGFISLDVENAYKLGLHHLSEAQLQIITSMVLVKPTTVTEAALDLLGEEIVQASHRCEYIDSRPPGVGSISVSRGNIDCLSKLDHYKMRPLHPDLENISFKDYYRWYHIQSTKKKREACVGRETRPDGWFVYRCKEQRLVRFSDCNPKHDLEGFCFNILLDNLAFRSIADLFSPANVELSYFKECQLRGFLKDADDFLRLFQQYSIDHLWSEDYFAQLSREILDDLVFLDDTCHDAGDDAPSALAAVTPQQLLTARVALHSTWLTAVQDMPLPTEEQARVLDDICAQSGGFFKIVGGPGRGKSVTIKHLYRRFEEKGHRVAVCASTGIAASLLGLPEATTLHSLFGIRGDNCQPRELHPANPKYQYLSEIKLLIIDEVSMIKNSVMNFAMDTLKHCWQGWTREDWPACVGRFVVFVGDTGQLPPVCNHFDLDAAAASNTTKLRICGPCHISSNQYYKHARAYGLTRPLRQVSDPEFIEFLDIIRTRKPTQAEIDQYLDRCVVTEEEFRSLLAAEEEVLIVCTHRVDVDRHNAEILNDKFASAVVRLPTKTTYTGQEATVLAYVNDPKFNELPAAAVGAKVMFTTNNYIQHGAANGVRGVVTGFFTKTNAAWTYDSQHDLHKIAVKLDTNGTEVYAARTKSGRQYRRAVETDVTRNAFPLKLGYAITGHKSQGATISGKCALDVRTAFAPGLLYVMLTRVTNRANLFLLRRLTPDDFEPVPLKFQI